MAKKTADTAAAPAAAPAAPAPAPAAEKAPKAPKAPKIERESQNGQTKPADGTKTGKLWAIIDKLSAEKQEPASRKEVLEAAEKDGFNLAMAASLYAHWRKFHGLVGRAAPGKAAAAETAPAAPAAEETGE